MTFEDVLAKRLEHQTTGTGQSRVRIQHLPAVTLRNAGHTELIFAKYLKKREIFFKAQ